ncbi:VOC family protein [Galactobacter caseinivorans]|uniref:Glyoxalase n=1 Tax=Galactobacter caseinivorans TaxID=2676123 RepID=A0A496PH39_9MICC|nr:VOC family protein [Galactobacter caseinivorans]RKW69797.1 glyoxalase [Galactobacter caseinivorans]
MSQPAQFPQQPGPSITALTLGVRDVEASLAFYEKGLGYRRMHHVPGEIAFVQISPGVMLSLWNLTSMPSEYGDVGFGTQAPPLSLGHNAASPAEVFALTDQALEAGATLVTEPSTRSWGGTSACVADPDGFRIDFVHNPTFSLLADGTVTV